MQKIKHFIKTHPHMWWGLYLPVYLILYFVVEHVVTDNYWATQTVIDDYIPFCEYFVIPYDSWGILLFILGVFFIVKDPERQNICTWILQMTWAADNNANVFPSVHVLGVVAAIAAMWHSPKLKRVWQIVGTVWFVIIAASTLLVKQHAFIDLAAALVWGAVV